MNTKLPDPIFVQPPKDRTAAIKLLVSASDWLLNFLNDYPPRDRHGNNVSYDCSVATDEIAAAIDVIRRTDPKFTALRKGCRIRTTRQIDLRQLAGGPLIKKGALGTLLRKCRSGEVWVRMDDSGVRKLYPDHIAVAE